MIPLKKMYTTQKEWDNELNSDRNQFSSYVDDVKFFPHYPVWLES